MVQEEEHQDQEQLRVCVIGDPHFKVDNVTESQEMIDKTRDLVYKLKPDLIVCLGDILDRHEKIHVDPLSIATDFLSTLVDIAPTVVLIGNHDRPNNSDFLSSRHPFNAMKRWSNMTVVDKVIDVNIKGFRFVYVPYVPPGRFREALYTVDSVKDALSQIDMSQNNNLQNNKLQIDKLQNNNIIDVIFAHQEFYNAQMGAIKSAIGDKWPSHYPFVISGHIHDYQLLQDNILYGGTPNQHNYGDRDDKTISVITFTRIVDDSNMVNTRVVDDSNMVAKEIVNTRIVNNIQWSEERHDLKLVKRKIFHLKTSEILTWICPEDLLVKIIIDGTSAEIKATMKLLYIKELEKKGVLIVYNTIPSNDIQTNNIQLNIQNNSSSNERIKRIEYLERFGNSVKHDLALNNLFEKLFGSVNPITKNNIIRLNIR
jgi:DNA repair exonuclease SbcCD nuclease subunit